MLPTSSDALQRMRIPKQPMSKPKDAQATGDHKTEERYKLCTGS